MFILKQIIKLIRLLHADEGALSLALGFSLSLIPGFAGFASVLGLLTLILVIFFRIQMGAYFLGFFFFSLLSITLSSPINSVGYALLTNPSLESFWTMLYTWPLMHWLKFNHTSVLGGQVIALMLFPFVFIIFNFLIQKYQKTVVRQVKESNAYKWFVKTTFFLNYNNILESLKG
jgi:uncharacterized protein (TIGR03546 family)